MVEGPKLGLLMKMVFVEQKYETIFLSFNLGDGVCVFIHLHLLPEVLLIVGLTHTACYDLPISEIYYLYNLLEF